MRSEEGSLTCLWFNEKFVFFRNRCFFRLDTIESLSHCGWVVKGIYSWFVSHNSYTSVEIGKKYIYTRNSLLWTELWYILKWEGAYSPLFSISPEVTHLPARPYVIQKSILALLLHQPRSLLLWVITSSSKREIKIISALSTSWDSLRLKCNQVTWKFFAKPYITTPKSFDRLYQPLGSSENLRFQIFQILITNRLLSTAVSKEIPQSENGPGVSLLVNVHRPQSEDVWERNDGL